MSDRTKEVEQTSEVVEEVPARAAVEITHAVTYLVTDKGVMFAPNQVVTEESDTRTAGENIDPDAPAIGGGPAGPPPNLIDNTLPPEGSGEPPPPENVMDNTLPTPETPATMTTGAPRPPRRA